MREATILIGAMGTAAWLVVLGAVASSPDRDPATADLDWIVGIGVTILYAVTAAPALALALYRRAPRAAFALAIAFPGLLGLAFATVVMTLGER